MVMFWRFTCIFPVECNLITEHLENRNFINKVTARSAKLAVFTTLVTGETLILLAVHVVN